jgi:hypothetical protein
MGSEVGFVCDTIGRAVTQGVKSVVGLYKWRVLQVVNPVDP